ncbi:MAG: GspH/FimT family pseudopilin [Pseudomonadota bacterium]
MTLTSATDRRRSGGFTLLELMIVLAILAMGSMLVIPGLTGMESRTFNAQVREASSLLNYARRTAVVTGRPAVASFQSQPDESEVEDDAAVRTSEAARSTLGPDAPWSSRGVEIAYRDSTQQLVDVEDAIDITFFPEGGSTGGELILTLDDREAVIVIDPFSGRVRTELPDD